MMVGCAAVAPAISAQEDYLFAYFKEPGNQGIYLALSHDGYHYTALNDGQPWVKPEHEGEIMRDVFLTRGPDGVFQMVWTWGWRGLSLGHAESKDLMTWSLQTEVPIMASHPEMRNVWAPEMDWDAQKKVWVLFWSSAPKDEEQGNRIWFAETKDFKEFSTPKIFFDPGYEVIDATMFHAKGKEYLVFKDQTRDPLRYQVRYVTGPTVEGPWGSVAAPLTESWSEGPSVVQVGDEVAVFYDHYRSPHAQYEAVESMDWVHWTSANDKISLPQYCKHGSFLRISAEESARLEARHDPAPVAGDPPSTSK
ncbi:MAG: glycoside hydrolase family 43 protein [Acidobacteriota bacterium]